MLQSRNYAPSLTLAPYVLRHYVFEAALPEDFVLVDSLLSETAFIRVLLKGRWTAETAPGKWEYAGPTVLFGSNGRPLKVRVEGSFKVVGIAIRPSGWRALFGCPASDFADRMVPLADAWNNDANALHAAIKAGHDDAEIIAGIEDMMLKRIAGNPHHAIDAPMRLFETIARHDSTIRVDDAARQLGLSVRQMERQCCASFGHTPKMLLRRSRFLDLAMAMRGFSDPSQEELAALRFFDQSHLNREFRRFIGMPPGQFAKTPTPLFTAGLKLRSEGIGLGALEQAA